MTPETPKPEDPQKETERAFNRQIWEVGGGKVTRRKALVFLGAWAGSLIAGPTLMIKSTRTGNRYQRRIDKFNENYPQLPEAVLQDVDEYGLYKYLTDDDSQLYHGEGMREASDRVFKRDEEHFSEIKSSWERYQQWRKQRDTEAERIHGNDKSDAGFMLGFGFIAAAMSPIIYVATQELRHKSSDLFPSVTRLDDLYSLAKKAKPEWITERPSNEDLRDFFNRSQLLPPVGGKVVAFTEGKEDTTRQFPHLSAEQHVSEVNEAKHEGKYGEVFVHQLTVQGKLPDRFKYAALALILNSPYQASWESPFFKAPWGTVAPLVHDGGNTNRKLNKLWKKVDGRTDFIQRAFVNYDESNPDTLGNAANQFEDERMLMEARFYQRAALALHAFLGTAPRVIPKDMRQALAEQWLGFEERMRSSLEEFEIESAADVPWFLDNAREVTDWPGKRHEADYEPIQRELVHLEVVRKARPLDVRERATQIMTETAHAIDRIIGLDKYLKSA